MALSSGTKIIKCYDCKQGEERGSEACSHHEGQEKTVECRAKEVGQPRVERRLQNLEWTGCRERKGVLDVLS